MRSGRRNLAARALRGEETLTIVDFDFDEQRRCWIGHLHFFRSHEEIRNIRCGGTEMTEHVGFAT